MDSMIACSEAASETFSRTCFFHRFDKPLATLVLGQKWSSLVTRKRENMRLAVIVVLDLLAQRSIIGHGGSFAV